MPRTRFAIVIAGAALVTVALLPRQAAVVADDDHDQTRFSASLISFNEVPSISSPAKGTFRARLNDDGDSLHYRLSYSGITGATVTQGHIHFGERHTNGGIMVWLCSGPVAKDPTGLAPDCPQPPGGSVEGDITAANIVQTPASPAPPSPPAQGIAPGEFAEFLQALRKGAGYANVHSNLFPGGEIRGQIR